MTATLTNTCAPRFTTVLASVDITSPPFRVSHYMRCLFCVFIPHFPHCEVISTSLDRNFPRGFFRKRKAVYLMALLFELLSNRLVPHPHRTQARKCAPGIDEDIYGHNPSLNSSHYMRCNICEKKLKSMFILRNCEKDMESSDGSRSAFGQRCEFGSPYL